MRGDADTASVTYTWLGTHFSDNVPCKMLIFSVFGHCDPSFFGMMQKWLQEYLGGEISCARSLCEIFLFVGNLSITGHLSVDFFCVTACTLHTSMDTFVLRLSTKIQQVPPHLDPPTQLDCAFSFCISLHVIFRFM